MVNSKPSRLVGARGPGRPAALDALDLVAIVRLTHERGASAELVAAVFGITTDTVRAALRGMGAADHNAARGGA